MGRSPRGGRWEFWSKLKHFTTLIIQCKFKPLVLNTYWRKNAFSTFPSIQIYRDTNLTLPQKGQRSTYDHHFNKLCRAWFLMLYTKIQPESFLGSREDFQEFLPYMDMAPFCSIMRNLLNKLAIPFRQKAHMKSGENCSSSFREEDI